MNVIIWFILHFSLGWFLLRLYLVLVEPFNYHSRGAVKPLSIADFLMFCSSKISCQLVIDLMFHFHFELIFLHVIQNIWPRDWSSWLCFTCVAAARPLQVKLRLMLGALVHGWVTFSLRSTPLALFSWLLFVLDLLAQLHHGFVYSSSVYVRL
jgi:hypothetical protein